MRSRGLILHPSSFADVPNLINYQGRLRDNATGLPLNGMVNIQVNLFTNETGGVPALPAQNVGLVPVTNGVYSFHFGNAALPGLLSNPEVWLQVTVDGNILSPRQRLIAVPYAVVARAVQSQNLMASDQGITLAGGSRLCRVTERILIENDDADSWLTFHDPGAVWYSMGIDFSDGRKFKLNYGGETGIVPGLTMIPGGYFGIHTTNPTAPLHVFGNLIVEGSSSGWGGDIQLRNNQTGLSGQGGQIMMGGSDIAPHDIYNKHLAITSYANGATNTGSRGITLSMQGASEGEQQLRIVNGNHSSGTLVVVKQASGNVGIGTTNPVYKLHVNGSVAGVGAYQNVSDARLKKNIAPITNALATVEALRGVRFDWRNDEHPEFNFESGPQVGLIAQEVERVLPEAVSKDAQGNYAVAYSKLVPVLVEALKAQQRQLERQQTEIDQLKRLFTSNQKSP